MNLRRSDDSTETASGPVPPPPASRVPPPPLPGSGLGDGDAPPSASLEVPADAVVVVDRVSKWFGDLVAVSDVTFGLGPGVTALLGPNGAGKSTILRMMAGLAFPSSGRVRVDGKDPRRDATTARNIGLAPQQEAVFDRMRAIEFVAMSARLQGLSDFTLRAKHALGLVDLDAADTRQLRTYSKGMRQRVKLAQAIVHDPQVILLDEPLSGLDPRQRVDMVALLHQLGREGKVVIVSSHVLDEVERLGSNVIVIAKGRLAAQGDFREIRALMDDRPHQVIVASDRPRSLAAALISEPSVRTVSVDDQRISVEVSDMAAFSSSVAVIAHRIGARLFELRSIDEDLESVFRYLVTA